MVLLQSLVEICVFEITEVEGHEIEFVTDSPQFVTKTNLRTKRLRVEQSYDGNKTWEAYPFVMHGEYIHQQRLKKRLSFVVDLSSAHGGTEANPINWF